MFCLCARAELGVSDPDRHAILTASYSRTGAEVLLRSWYRRKLDNEIVGERI